MEKMIEVDICQSDKNDARSALVVKHKGKILFYELDYGEPEDNSFYRDWAWIQPAIETAYRLGREDEAASRDSINKS